MEKFKPRRTYETSGKEADLIKKSTPAHVQKAIDSAKEDAKKYQHFIVDCSTVNGSGRIEIN